jgi:hypothetical protein
LRKISGNSDHNVDPRTDSCDPLRSHAIELKIAKLKKAEGEMKLYEEETIGKMKREMSAVMRREQQDQEGKVEDLCKELVNPIEIVALEDAC